MQIKDQERLFISKEIEETIDLSSIDSKVSKKLFGLFDNKLKVNVEKVCESNKSIKIKFVCFSSEFKNIIQKKYNNFSIYLDKDNIFSLDLRNKIKKIKFKEQESAIIVTLVLSINTEGVDNGV